MISPATSSPTSSAKGLLVAKESYTHSYLHCWRCGTQSIRLVDEWFIAMDPLREPISARRGARWLPEGIGLMERELDWPGTWATG